MAAPPELTDIQAFVNELRGGRVPLESYAHYQAARQELMAKYRAAERVSAAWTAATKTEFSQLFRQADDLIFGPASPIPPATRELWDLKEYVEGGDLASDAAISVDDAAQYLNATAAAVGVANPALAPEA